MNWTHDGLQADLASHLAATRDRIIWEDMQLGPAGSPRPDVYTVPKSFTHFRPIAYEIKISVADFRRDVTAGKWQNYLEFACGVTFAVPSGLIAKADVPPGCGLMVRGEDGWRTLKAPTLKHLATLPHAAWMKLFIDGISRQQQMACVREKNRYKVEDILRKKYGDRIGRLISEAAESENILESTVQNARARNDEALRIEQDRHKRELAQLKGACEQIDSGRALLAEALGLDPNESVWVVVRALQEARNSIRADEEVKRLSGIISRVRRVIGEAQ